MQTIRLGVSRTRIGQDVEANLASPLAPFVAGRDLVGDIDITGMQRFGPQSSANLRLVQTVLSGQYDVIQTRGRHLVKAGVLAERYRDSMVNPTFSLGIYTFAGPRAFLENRPLRFIGLSPQGAIDRDWPFTLLGFYAQDGFTVHPRLTLTGGLRYEFTTMPVDRGRRDSALINLTDAAPTVGRLYRNPTYANVSPRAGAAWDVFGDGSTSIRGGYGLYFNTNNQQNLIVTVTNPPATPRFVIANPTFPTPPFERGVGNSIRPVQWNLENPRLHMGNVSVQRLMPGKALATLGFAASRGVHLLRSGDVNIPAPTLQPDGRLLFPPAGTPRPNRAFSTIELKSSDGNSWYKALIVEVRRRWENGLSAQSSYTWSKTVDTTQASTFFSDATNGTTSAFPEFGTDYNRGPADWDTPHNWVFNVAWDVPAVGPARALLAGWRLAYLGPAPAPLLWIRAQVGASLRLIPVEEVDYLRSDTKYTRVAWRGDGGEPAEALVRTPLKELVTQLDPAHFAQIHRSIVVNLRAIDHVTRGDHETAEVHLRGRDEVLPVSRSHLHLFRQM